MADTVARYFIKAFGSQRILNPPRFSHTFAAFTEEQVGADGSVTAREDGQLVGCRGTE
jgi:hypothetical protein